MKLRGIELDTRIAHDLALRQIVGQRPEIGAVLRRLLKQMVGHLHTAGADHVLHHDVRIARNMLADMTACQPRIGVILAADPDADQQVDRLAFIKIGNVVGAQRW